MQIDEISHDQHIRLESDLIIIGDSVVTDRHHASSTNYEADDPQNQIGGIIPSFTLSGWLRHGMEAVVIDRGGTVCHPGEPSANYVRESEYERDLQDGYHEKGSCIDEDGSDDGCIVFDLFGGFGGAPGKFMRRPIRFSPIRSSIDYTRGQAEGHYRRVSRSVVSRNPADHRTPLRFVELDAIGNLDGCWHLHFRELKPEFLGLLCEAVEFLNAHNTDYIHQLGGARNFGAGIVDSSQLNPLYNEKELTRVFDRAKKPTVQMQEKDDTWESEYRPVAIDALDARLESGG